MLLSMINLNKFVTINLQVSIVSKSKIDTKQPDLTAMYVSITD